MHDRLFADQKSLQPAQILSSAASLGLNIDQFTACLEQEGVKRVIKDTEVAKKLQLSNTPVFLVGRMQSDKSVKVDKVIMGARPINDFVQGINPLLKG
jgi:predicted DsbA family dithiol-disulfide isomerase